MTSTPEFDAFTDFEEALAQFVRASYPPDERARGPASDRSAEARISQSSAATLGPADLRAQVPREQRSQRHRGTLSRVAIAVCLGAAAIWAWRSYGGPAHRTPDPVPEQAAALPAVETSAPSPARVALQAVSIAQPATAAANEPGAALSERRQIDTSDLDALRQTVEQLAAGQERLTRAIAKLKAEKPQADKPPAKKADKPTLRRVSAHPARRVAAARKPAPRPPMAPQAASQVSRVSRLSPPPQPASQIPLEPQHSYLPPVRPPMPVPQP